MGNKSTSPCFMESSTLHTWELPVNKECTNTDPLWNEYQFCQLFTHKEYALTPSKITKVKCHWYRYKAKNGITIYNSITTKTAFAGASYCLCDHLWRNEAGQTSSPSMPYTFPGAPPVWALFHWVPLCGLLRKLLLHKGNLLSGRLS